MSQSFFMDIKGVSRFYVIQADGAEGRSETISDEKEFLKLEDALSLIEQSEAPVKYLKFNMEGSEYKLYPIVDSEEYKVVKNPILN